MLKQLRAAGVRTEGLAPADEFLGACMQGDESTARAVLEKTPGLMGNLTPDDQQMLIHAAQFGRVPAVRLMATLGFDIAVLEPEDSATALHVAAWWSRAEVVKLLVSLGAPLDVRDSRYGCSPIAWAAHGSSYCRKADEEYCAVVDALIDAGAAYAPAMNKWNVPAEKLASPAVRVRLIQRGFVPKPA